jgi:hypothetical protein
MAGGVRLCVARRALAIAVVGIAGLTVAGCATHRAPAAPQAARDRSDERAREPRPDHPGEAVAFRLLSLKDENGFIPPDGLMKARAHANEMRALRLSGAAPPLAGISRDGWTWKGPGNIGGRTRALAIDPANANNILAGTVAGGIWRSTNAGASWAPVDDFMANLAVTSIVYRPGSPNTLYAATGEGFFNGDAIRGAGIFRSIDNGVTWTQLASTANANFYYVNRLAFSADGSMLLAATGTGVWRSADGGVSWGAGAVLTIYGNSTVTDVKFLSGSSTQAVAAGYTGIAYWSNDGGASFNAAPGFSQFSPYGTLLTRIELAPSPSVTNHVYAVLDASGGKLYKSVDGGQSYALVSTPGHLGSQGWYDNALWVAPNDENVLVVGGVDLWRSTNGGVTWTKISTWFNAPASAHADQHAIVSAIGYNGTSNTRVYFGNDGGVYKADDVLAAATGGPDAPTIPFTFLNSNFGATQFYGAAGNASSGRITGGTQDNGDLFLDTGGSTQSWADKFGGDGGFSAYDPGDPNYFYGEYISLKIHRNSTGGASASSNIYGVRDGPCPYPPPFCSPCKLRPYLIDEACFGGANFIAPFILDPNDPNTILAGGQGLWRSNDVKAPLTLTTGPQWFIIKYTLPAPSPISAIAVAPGNSALIYVGHNNGDVYKTANGTAAPASVIWTKVDSAGMPNSQVQRIAIDPNDGNNVYVAYGGFTGTNLWRSTDGGSVWTLSVGSGVTALPAAPVRGIAIHPTIPGWIYAGTEVGVFASADGGATWSTSGDGPANVSVDELSWMGNTLVAATHGRGVYTTVVPLSPPTTMPFIDLDTPREGYVVTSSFEVGGWALDQGSPTGTGVDAVQFYVFPNDGASPGVFIGTGSYGLSRPDVAAFFGDPRFTNTGFHFSITGLGPGAYVLGAYARSTVTGTFSVIKTVHFTVNANQLMAVNPPVAEAVITTTVFDVDGWSIDKAVESTADPGTGVDTLHVYAYPNPGSGAPPIFLGVATYGLSRPDVAAIYGGGGPRYVPSGFHLGVDRSALGLTNGVYSLVVFSHSTVSGTFNNLAVVRVTLQ